MASTDIQYNCGCGYKTDKLEAAANHSDQRQHVMTAQGNIYPDEAKESLSIAPPRTRKTAAPVTAAPVVIGPSTDFAALKKKLQKK